MRKRLTIVCTACVLLFGCQNVEVSEAQPKDIERLERQHAAWARSVPRPSQQLVGRIEALLGKETCVGRLDRWARYYAYNHDMPGNVLYTEIVDFHLEEAGKFGVKPDLQVTYPNAWVNIDDRPMRIAWGDYDIAEDQIRFSFCGDNGGGPRSNTDINNFRGYWEELKRRRSAYQSDRAR